MKRLILTGLLLTTLSFGAQAKTGSKYKMSDLKDVPNEHWAYKAVQYCYEDNWMTQRHILSTRTPKYFEGDAHISRYELAQAFNSFFDLFSSITGIDIRFFKPTKNFKDVDIQFSKDVKIVTEDYQLLVPQTIEFKGNSHITRFQMAQELNTFLNRFSNCRTFGNQKHEQSDIQFHDVSTNHKEYKTVEAVVGKYHIFKGKNQNYFDGDSYLSRYEAATIFYHFYTELRKTNKIYHCFTPRETAMPAPPTP